MVHGSKESIQKDKQKHSQHRQQEINAKDKEGKEKVYNQKKLDSGFDIRSIIHLTKCVGEN